MTRFITDEERDRLNQETRAAIEAEQARRDAIAAAQSRVDREHLAEHERLRYAARALTFLSIAVLALTAAALLGSYFGGRP
jgi:hypothetical protein